MSDYKDKKVKRKLKKISFDFDKAHLAYTDGSAGGACSLVNDPILLKSLEAGKELSVEQRSLLESMGYDLSEVDKSIEETKKSSASNEVSEADNLNIDKGNDDNMSQELLKAQEDRIAALEKQLKVSNAVNALTKYNLDVELKKDLAESIADEAVQTVVLKALDALIAAGKVELEAAVEKAKTTTTEENPLAKALSNEAGEGGEVEQPVEKSRSEKIAEFLKKSAE